MAEADIGKRFQDSLKGIFHWGSRYHAEKIGVLAGFVILSLATGIWAFSGDDDTNELGADLYLRDAVVGVDLVVENTGRGDWRDVRIALDRQYLFTTERIEGGDYVSLSADDLVYAYYIPRPWRREGWERLGSDIKPGVHPDASYVPSFVQVRAREGRLDTDVDFE